MSSSNHSQQPYPHAPITEAVIDLRVELSPEVSASDLARVQKGEEHSYPTVKPINEFRGQISFPEASAGASAVPGTSASTTPIGFLFRSTDGRQIQQARTNGFTMSRLAPYLHWDGFRTETRRLWDIYRSVAKPSRVTRVAVRYINRIDIPLPLSDLEDYLRTVPTVSSDLPQGLSRYFMQLVMPLEEIKGMVIINETIIEPAKPEVVSIVLDIDVSRSNDLPSTEEGIWAMMEQLRNAKNNVFEACITDKARELFQ